MSTTLVTFLFDYPAAARTVELLGSWDNFTKPYALQPDRRRGYGIWSGCYTFDDIICDGDLGNVGGKRTGALKMGGTYWYYYKVDDEEYHNPSEPSTTVCPLLPGQRLNVLDVPRESRSRSNSESSGAFTRNPEDKFLTPVPPKPLPSPRLGDLCKQSYTVPTHHWGGPRSATYPSTSPSLLPVCGRHARSASTTPALSSTPLFTDFKGLKEKFAHKRTASNPRSRSRSMRELEIGAPTLISTTAEEVNLIPLSSLQPPPTSSPLPTPKSSPSLPPPVTAKLREFSPLGSHPVDPVKDLGITLDMDRPATKQQRLNRPRSRSHVPEITTTDFTPEVVVRANSAETRRTKLFSNEPWLTSPKVPFPPNEDAHEAAEATEAPPMLQRPTSSLEPPSLDARPSSSHGEHRSSGLRKSALDKDKELPALPRFLTPAPLFACHSEGLTPKLQQEPDTKEEHEDEHVNMRLLRDRASHFSEWSADSTLFSSVASDDDGIHSPTFSSLTSNCSGMDSPIRDPARFSISDYMDSPDRTTAINEETGYFQTEEPLTDSPLSATPSRLDEVRASSFGPNLFDLDILHPEAAPRRQAACFGLGFQAYKLPEEETASKVTITESSLLEEPTVTIKHNRGSSVSHVEKLVNEFGFLGDSVL